ncbi:hypothetical protein L596_017138 [Steinernema carpocapsae]|uniref:Uncharacterized protein n=1 Tax=Steinernema carpocapsae TaxID=34508 RepID=A0A4U5N0P1_STECR|nr:hypothetical protein L596_017138 [Steinernema carpocapsae]
MTRAELEIACGPSNFRGSFGTPVKEIIDDETAKVNINDLRWKFGLNAKGNRALFIYDQQFLDVFCFTKNAASSTKVYYICSTCPRIRSSTNDNSCE